MEYFYYLSRESYTKKIPQFAKLTSLALFIVLLSLFIITIFVAVGDLFNFVILRGLGNSLFERIFRFILLCFVLAPLILLGSIIFMIILESSSNLKICG